MEQGVFFAVKVAQGKEEKVLEVYNEILARRDNNGIYSAIFNPKVKGYIFVEAESLSKAVDSIRKVPNMKYVIRQPIPFEQIEKYLSKEAEEGISVHERDIVEIITGPFKGYRAKVTRVSPNKDEIIVELLDIPNPIPITLNNDDLRLIESGEENES